MNHPSDLHTIVCEIKAAQEEARQIEPLTSRFNGFDVASAYEVALLIHEAHLEEGNVSVGRKIGFTNPAHGTCTACVSRYGPTSMTPR